jgi:hypothetical protein
MVLYTKPNIHFRSYLAQFFFEWEMFQTKVVETIKTHILCSVTFIRKTCSLWDNVEKYGTAWQTDNILRLMCIACWVTKAINTHSEYVIHIAFPQTKWLHESASVLCHTYTVCLVAVSVWLYSWGSIHLYSKYTGLVKIMLTLMDYFSPADRRMCVRALNDNVTRWLSCVKHDGEQVGTVL